MSHFTGLILGLCMWDAPTLNVLGHCSDIGSYILPFPPVIWLSTPQPTGQRPAKGWLPYGSQNCRFFCQPSQEVLVIDGWEQRRGSLFFLCWFINGAPTDTFLSWITNPLLHGYFCALIFHSVTECRGVFNFFFFYPPKCETCSFPDEVARAAATRSPL